MTGTRATAGRTNPAAAVSDGGCSEDSVPSVGAAPVDRSWWAKPPMAVIGRHELSDGAYRLWTWLDAKAGNSALAKASYAEMATAMRGEARRPCSPKTVARRVRELLDLELLTVEREPAGHGRGWYVVVNPARRRGDRSDAPTPAPEWTDLSDAETDLSGLEAVEASEVSPLLGSRRDLDEGSPRASREAVGLALVVDAFPGAVLVHDDDAPRCASVDGCERVADGGSGPHGERYCRVHEPF